MNRATSTAPRVAAAFATAGGDTASGGDTTARATSAAAATGATESTLMKKGGWGVSNRRWAVVAAAAGGVLILTCCLSAGALLYWAGGGVTLAKYEKIQVGHTRAEVAKIMGFAGTEESHRSIPGVFGPDVMIQSRDMVVVAWKNWDGSGVWCTFENDFMRTKRQKGLTR